MCAHNSGEFKLVKTQESEIKNLMKSEIARSKRYQVCREWL